ncbi:MAG: hypothetical protein IT583_03615 [Verrucomicrobia bacterium]|nr:hypothetical protein [Verrucomicrobiota bacterium]
MKKTILAVCFALFSGVVRAGEPSFGDLAVLLAKGYFGGYVKQDASLQQCVAFLNSKGVYFSPFDLLDSEKAVSREEFARVVGQSMLLFSGKAELVQGRIKKPVEAETWVDYCLLNDIDLLPIWGGFVQCTKGGSLPEVKAFLGKQSGDRQ